MTSELKKINSKEADARTSTIRCARYVWTNLKCMKYLQLADTPSAPNVFWPSTAIMKNKSSVLCAGKGSTFCSNCFPTVTKPSIWSRESDSTICGLTTIDLCCAGWSNFPICSKTYGNTFSDLSSGFIFWERWGSSGFFWSFSHTFSCLLTCFPSNFSESSVS